MSTLYLDRKNVQLSVSGGQLLVREPEAKLRSIPLKLLERVVIRHATQMESTLLGVFAEAGVALLCLSARNGRRTGRGLILCWGFIMSRVMAVSRWRVM
ncbi:MAG: CRISPR-associated endonuclease Cas1 [Gammaproteobacteria bacterium]|nr:CRISPR-associated endonuclease Cas1 [Gammaproteobacteria bacterium]